MKLNKAREQLIQMYIDSLKENILPWKKGWKDDYSTQQQNPVSRIKYRGTNRALLDIVSNERGYKDPRWLTFNQIKDKGWVLEDAKGKGIPVEYWSVYDIEAKKAISLAEYNTALRNDPACAKNFRIMERTYYVFNAEHIKGIPVFDLSKQPKKLKNVSPFIENLITNMDVGYEEYGDRAFYKPSIDSVVVPKSPFFNSQYEYESTRLHELCHASGNSLRLNRDLGEFGSKEYAIEELRAEIASSFIAQEVSVSPSQTELAYHKAYIKNWVAILNNEPAELFKAIKDAEKISDYILQVGEFEKYKHIETEQMTENMNMDDNLFAMPDKEYPLNLSTLLDEKNAVVLYKLGVKICVRCGYVDKNMQYYSNGRINSVTSNMTIEQETEFFEKKGIITAGHRIINDTDFEIMTDAYAHAFLDPKVIPFDKMNVFIRSFEFLTDEKYHFFNENECNQIQEEMVKEIPITYEKVLMFRDKYITKEVIESISKNNNWKKACKNLEIDVEDYIRKELGWEKSHIPNETKQAGFERGVSDKENNSRKIGNTPANEIYVDLKIAEEIGDEIIEELNDLNEVIHQYIHESGEAPKIYFSIEVDGDAVIKKHNIKGDILLQQFESEGINVLDALKVTIDDQKALHQIELLQEKTVAPDIMIEETAALPV